MAEGYKTKLILNPGSQRSKRGAYHQRSEGGFKRIYASAPETMRERGPVRSKTSKRKRPVGGEIAIHVFQLAKRPAGKRRGKGNAKQTAKK